MKALVLVIGTCTYLLHQPTKNYYEDLSLTLFETKHLKRTC